MESTGLCKASEQARPPPTTACQVKAEPERPDGGARFEQQEKIRILLVDDRPEHLLALRTVLERPDYELVTATSGEDALAQLLRGSFAVIVMDVAMPELDGFATASLIRRREKARGIPIIFMSGSAHDMDLVYRGYEAGAVDFLAKPLDPRAIRAKVAVFAELFRHAREIERAGESLSEAERKQRAIAEAMYDVTFEEAPIGIGHLTLDARWVRVNRTLAEIVGRPVADLSGLTLLELLHPDDKRRLTGTIAQHLASPGAGGRLRGEYRLVRPGGSSVWTVLTLSTLRAPGGAPVRLALVEDISEQRRMVDEMRHSIQARDDFLSLAAHELRNPLSPILMMVTSLLAHCRKTTQPIAPSWLVRQLEPVDRSVLRMQELIDTLLDFSRVTVGHLPLSLEEVDLSELAREIVSRMQPELKRARCPISLRAEVAVVGRWDRTRLAQAVTNLLANAVKYGAGEPIEVETGGDGALGRLSIRDHGAGIAPEDQARIFERFERLAPVRNYGGFGLGLWMTRQIVWAHSGTIRVWSEPGEGSRFTMELPRVPPATRPAGGEPGALP